MSKVTKKNSVKQTSPKQPVTEEVVIPKSFEESLPTINKELAKQRQRWTLTSINWMDYDDVAQIIRFHIYNKWGQYNPKFALEPWLACIIHNQIRNLIRNNYSNYSRPCLPCEAAIGDDGCKIYGKQCSDCPAYANWKMKKEPATNVKLPVSIESHIDETSNIFDDSIDIFKYMEIAHEVMKNVLKPFEYKVYKELYINHKEESQVAKMFNYISNQKGRNQNYKQIKNIQKVILEKFKKALKDGLIEFL